MENVPLVFGYTNWKGKYGIRHVIPKSVYYGNCPEHLDPHWYMEAWDLDKQAMRTFAMKDMRMDVTEATETKLENPNG